MPGTGFLCAVKIDIDCVEVIEADLSDINHKQALIELTNVYMNDEMGNGCTLNLDMEKRLVQGLGECRGALLLFAKYKNKLIGLATCFVGFSTFYAKRLINIHDVIVLPQYRQNGVAKKLFSFLENKARSMDCCKLTLEVRSDNVKAMRLYKKLGFNEEKHPMYFWTKILEV